MMALAGMPAPEIDMPTDRSSTEEMPARVGEPEVVLAVKATEATGATPGRTAREPTVAEAGAFSLPAVAVVSSRPPAAAVVICTPMWPARQSHTPQAPTPSCG